MLCRIAPVGWQEGQQRRHVRQPLAAAPPERRDPPPELEATGSAASASCRSAPVAAVPCRAAPVAAAPCQTAPTDALGTAAGTTTTAPATPAAAATFCQKPRRCCSLIYFDWPPCCLKASYPAAFSTLSAVHATSLRTRPPRLPVHPWRPNPRPRSPKPMTPGCGGSPHCVTAVWAGREKSLRVVAAHKQLHDMVPMQQGGVEQWRVLRNLPAVPFSGEAHQKERGAGKSSNQCTGRG